MSARCRHRAAVHRAVRQHFFILNVIIRSQLLRCLSAAPGARGLARKDARYAAYVSFSRHVTLIVDFLSRKLAHRLLLPWETFMAILVFIRLVVFMLFFNVLLTYLITITTANNV